jgi:hypothetical protein
MIQGRYALQALMHSNVTSMYFGQEFEDQGGDN